MKFFEKAEEMGQRNKIVPAWLRAVIIVPLFILCAYMIIEDVGVYVWIKEAQLSAFDGFYVVLTGLLTLLVCLLPALPLVTMARKHYEKKQAEENPGEDQTLV